MVIKKLSAGAACSGHHEFYSGGDVVAQDNSWQRMVLPNVGYYQNEVVHVDDTDFILSTLWSQIRLQNKYFVACGMNDFRQINYGDRRFTTDDFNAEYDKCLSFIKRSVDESDAAKILLVTHHVPPYEMVGSTTKMIV